MACNILDNIINVYNNNNNLVNNLKVVNNNNLLYNERIKALSRLSPLGSNLINLLYKNSDNNSSAKAELITDDLRSKSLSKSSSESSINNINPIEPYIIEFDKNIENGEVIKAIGDRIGIYVYDSIDLMEYEIFLDKLVEYILTFNNKNIESYPTFEEIINMSYENFKNKMKEFNYNSDFYKDRLMVFVSMYKKKYSL